MCGIAGLIAFDPRLAADEACVRRMCARIAHRGPDGEGVLCVVGAAGVSAGLGHRRLAILDPQARSDQPFSVEHGGRRVHLTFNGEIYNFRELRARLETELPGFPWRTTGDTEVVLASYLAWGERCVDELLGMFAFAIFDEGSADRPAELFLARDRMGQKPLFIAPSHDAIAFASEIAPLLTLPWVDRTLSDEALGQYLAHGYVPTPTSIYRGITKLVPGTTLLLTQGREGRTRVFYDRNARSISPGPIVGAVRDALSGAVRSQLVSDVPLGCFLSGGIDSSVIALCASRARAAAGGERLLTFTARFDDPRYDESAFAEVVARHLGTDHRTFPVTPNIAEDLPQLAAAYGEPFADSSCLPTYYLSRETRPHVKVALSGDGGDELFCGYDRYRAMLWAERLGQLAGPLSWFLDAPTFAKRHPRSRMARLGRFLAHAEQPPAQRYEAYMRLFPPGVFGAPRLTGTVGNQRFSEGDVVTAAMAFDRVTYLEGDLLTKLDRASMLVGLEVRSPMMDHRLVALAAGATRAELLERGKKGLLKRAFGRDLPAAVFARRKMGFALPIGEWFRGPLRSMPRDLLLGTGSFVGTRFGTREVRAMLEEHESELADHSQRIFALVMLELWSKTG